MSGKKINVKNLIEKIEKRYKAYTDSFSSWFLYTAAISAIVKEKIIKQTLSAGAACCLMKPMLTPKQVLHTVETFVEKRM